MNVELLDLGELILDGVKPEHGHEPHPPAADVDPLPVVMEDNLSRGGLVDTHNVELLDLGQDSSLDIDLE